MKKVLVVAVVVVMMVAVGFFAPPAKGCEELNALLKLWQGFEGSQSFGVADGMNVVNVNVGGNQGAKLQIGAKGYNSPVGVTGKIDQQTEWSQGWSVLEEGWKAGQSTRFTTDQTLKVWGEIEFNDPKLAATQSLTGSLAGSFGVQDEQAVMSATGAQSGQQKLDAWKNGAGVAGAILTQSGFGVLSQGWQTPTAYQYTLMENNLSMKTWGQVR